ncbi:Uncharacterized protein Fot_48317 [Forsythia ovata]|uniref:Uncharacterized protein n=1 Tax=Forsythia ovata TaxID=205694 RepID=A0ABD1Q8N7_9LAMI
MLQFKTRFGLSSVKGKVPKAKPSTCVRGLLTRRVVNRGMCTSGRDLREIANRPTPRTDPHNISVKICPTRESNLRCRRISPHVTSSFTNSPMPLEAKVWFILLLGLHNLGIFSNLK